MQRTAETYEVRYGTLAARTYENGESHFKTASALMHLVIHVSPALTFLPAAEQHIGHATPCQGLRKFGMVTGKVVFHDGLEGDAGRQVDAIRMGTSSGMAWKG